jgi:hypothetical protein
MHRVALCASALIIITACASATSPGPETQITVDVKGAVSIEQPGAQYTTVRFDISIHNESTVDASVWFCALALQKDSGATLGFVTIGSNGCNELSGGTLISPNSAHTVTLTTNAKATDVTSSGSYRIMVPAFLGQSATRSSSLFSLPFTIGIE